MEAGTIARLPRDLTGLGNVEKCNARQTDQARARERHGRCSSRRNRCRLIHPSRNGAHYRIYVKGRLSWRPLSVETLLSNVARFHDRVVEGLGRGNTDTVRET